MWKKLWGGALGIILLTSEAWAAPIQFEDLGPAGSGILIPSNYAGFVWQNFRALNAQQEFATYGPNGYTAGLVSGDNVAFNFAGAPAVIRAAEGFGVGAFYASAAWLEGLQLTVTALRGTSPVFSGTYSLSTRGPLLIPLNLSDITTLRFSAAGGLSLGLNGTGTQFVLDDINLNRKGSGSNGSGSGSSDVPVPAALPLFAAALTGLGVLRRRVSGR